MQRLYHQDLYDLARPVESYWEASAPLAQAGYGPLESDARCAVAVIGGGYTGLSAALHLARDHGIEATVLEAGPIGWGASGRNGGHCTLAASKLSIEQMIGRYGEAETKRFFASQREAIELVDALGRDEAIDFDRQGDGNLEVAHRPAAFADLQADAETLQRLFGLPTRLMTREAFAEQGYDSQEQFGALHVGVGFGLHPLKLVAGLAEAARRRGARIHGRSAVQAWHREDGRHRLVTAGGSLLAERVILATNGFTPEQLHRDFVGRPLPALSNIVTTRPLTAEELAAQRWQNECPTTNTRDMLFYYRLLPDRRFLFGARGDTRGDLDSAARMRDWMVRRLGEVFPAWRDVPISHAWRGPICMTRRFTPALGRLEDDPSVAFGFGYHGNGVNSAPWSGMMLARLTTGARLDEVPAVMRGLPPRFPLPALRLWALRAAYLYYRLRDDILGG